MTDFAKETEEYCQLVEKVAEIEHQQWASWTDYQIRFAPIHGELTAKEYWRKKHELAQKPYSELSEEEKRKDRLWARKVLDIVWQHQKSQSLRWSEILAFQDKFYPNWLTEKPRLLYSTALAGEVGEVCGVITHLDGGGTNSKKYGEKQVLHEAVDSYIQLVLLLAKSGFSSEDFQKELCKTISQLYQRMEQKARIP